MTATVAVAYPHMNSLGGDNFWLIHAVRAAGRHRRLRGAAALADISALGIPVHRMIALTFAAGAALAGSAGLMMGNQFLVHPIGGVNLIITAYIAAVIGGWGSLPGAVLGAMLIALFQVIISAYVSYTAATAMLYLVVLLVLFFRPQGLLGSGTERRV